MSEGPAPSRGARRRASDLLALALVATSVGVVSVSAAPSLARELGLTHASLSRREPAHPLVDRSIGSPHEPGVHGPGGPGRGPGGVSGLGDRAAAPSDPLDEDADPGDARLAVAVRDVVVRDRADERASPVGKVPRGELLIVIREDGAWAMVAHLGGEGATTGWVRRGDLAIR